MDVSSCLASLLVVRVEEFFSLGITSYYRTAGSSTVPVHDVVLWLLERAAMSTGTHTEVLSLVPTTDSPTRVLVPLAPISFYIPVTCVNKV
jgi:hypothetical protein